jgi:type I restriction enzyme, S subunit
MSALPELPNGWRWKTVGELAADEPFAITDGPFGSNLKTSHYTESGPRVVRLQNIGDGVFNDVAAHISMEHYEHLSKHRVRAGDIVIAALGETLPRACLIPESVGPAIVKADCVRFRPHPAHNARYLNYALNSEGTRRLVEPIVHGVGRPRLNLTEIKSIPLPVAPRKQQDRIVERIESQLTRLDAGAAALKRVQANLKRYRAAVLKAACEGRLVPTEAALARREGRPRRDLASPSFAGPPPPRTKRRGGRLWGAGAVPHLTDEELQTLPQAWAWAKVGHLGVDPEQAVQVGPMSMKSSEFKDAGVPVLNVGCIQWGWIDAARANHLPEEKARRFERYRIQVGDVLFTRSGTVGRCAIATQGTDGSLMTFHLLRARPNPQKCLPAYLRIALEGAPHIRRQTKEASIGSTRAGFNTRLLAELDIPLPLLPEQHRIVAEVERCLSLADDLGRVVSADLHRANRLRESVLAAAFGGVR